MANIHSLSDMKKQGGGRGGGGPPPPNGPGGFAGLFGGMGGPPTPPLNEKNIKLLKTENALQQELKNAGSKLTVVDFTASWCGPCKQIAPVVADLSAKHTDVVFLKIDVDELQDTARRCNISSIPTFQFYKNSNKIAEFSGADPSQLQSTIEKYKAPSTESSGGGFTTGGYVLGGSKTNPSNPPNPQQPSNLMSPPFNPPPQKTSDEGNVNELFVSSLMDMGFTKEKAERAVIATKGAGVEAAMDWCFSHPDDEEGQKVGGENKKIETDSSIPMEMENSKSLESNDNSSTNETPNVNNEPTVHNAICNGCMQKIIGIRWKCAMCSDYDLCSGCYDKRTHNLEHLFDAFEKDIEEPEKKALTIEELEERKKLLQEKIKEKKALKILEEKQSEIEKEKNRIKNGKEAQEAKKLWEQKTRDREETLKRKEKEDEKKAKEKIKAKIEQDRLEREAAKKNHPLQNPIIKYLWKLLLLQYLKFNKKKNIWKLSFKFDSRMEIR